MNQNDFESFVKAMDLASGMLSKRPFDESVLKGYFSLLASYPIADIKSSLNALICSSDSQYGIRPDLIIKYMGISEARPETIESILAKAKVKESPVGIVASRHITQWDFNNMQSFDLRQKAAEFLEMLPRIEEEIQDNGYEDHILRLLVQYDIDPTSDFRKGVKGPCDDDKTRSQYKALMIEDRRKKDHWDEVDAKESEEISREGQLKVAKAMAEIGASLGAGTEKTHEYDNTAELKAAFDEKVKEL